MNNGYSEAGAHLLVRRIGELDAENARLRESHDALRAKVEECRRLLNILRPRTLVVYQDKRHGNGLAATSLTREVDAALAEGGAK